VILGRRPILVACSTGPGHDGNGVAKEVAMDGSLDAAVLDRLPVGVFLVGRDGGVLRANRAAARFFPGDRTDPSGLTIDDVLGGLRGSDALRQSIRGAMEAPTAPVGDLETVLDHSGERVVARLVVFARDEERYGVVVLSRPERGDDSEESVVSGIRERIGKIKHQVNNPLMGILGHAELLAMEASLSEEALERVEVIQSEARRIRDQVALLDRVLREISS